MIKEFKDLKIIYNFFFSKNGFINLLIILKIFIFRKPILFLITLSSEKNVTLFWSNLILFQVLQCFMSLLMICVD